MVSLEVLDELTLKVICNDGCDELIIKKGAFIAGETPKDRNYNFEKIMLGPQKDIKSALLGSITRRIAGENIQLTRVKLNGNSITYYADYGKHITVYKLLPNEILSIESENLLAFTSECKYSVRFIGVGILSQKGIVTTTITGRGDNSYVAVTTEGNPIVLSNVDEPHTITVDPDAVVCWFSDSYCDPDIKFDANWKTFIGQSSGESYLYEWDRNKRLTVVIQPMERSGGISVSID